MKWRINKMRKKFIKKLYTLYYVEGHCDEITNTHHMISYSAGKGECIKYHDTLISWLAEVIANDLQVGFGLRILTEDGNTRIRDHFSKLDCYTYICKNESREKVVEILANIIEYYLTADSHYYEFENDHIYLSTSLTGHTHYKSPYESDDNCETCDGARCEACKKKYTVKDLISDEYYYDGYDKEEAERILKLNKKNYSNVISDIIMNYVIDMDWYSREIGDNRDLVSLIKILNTYNILHITRD
jgi:hypothetical protein